MEYTTNQKGLITELTVMLELIKLGYEVSQPLNADSRYDCIVDTGNKLLRIQIKTSHLSKKTENSIQFSCRSVTVSATEGIKSKRYSSDCVDYFATSWENKIYLIPVNECSTEKTIHLQKKGDKPVKNWTYAEDYLAEKVLKAL